MRRGFQFKTSNTSELFEKNSKSDWLFSKSLKQNADIVVNPDLVFNIKNYFCLFLVMSTEPALIQNSIN